LSLFANSQLPALGTYGVLRYQNKKPLKPISPTSDASIVKGTSATNEISVSVKQQ
jgi:hypothetical protein